MTASSRSLLTGAGLTGFGTVVSAGAGFVTLALIAGFLGARGTGIFAVCTAISLLLTQLGKLGYDTTLVHLVPRLHSYGGDGQMRGLVRRCVGEVLAASVVVTALGWLLAPQLAAVLLSDVNAELGANAFRTTFLGQPVASATVVYLAAARGMTRLFPLVTIDQIAKPLLRLGLVGMALAMDGGVLAVLAAWALPQWGLFAASAVVHHRLVRGFRADRPDLALRKDARRYNRYRMISATAEVGSLHVGVLAVGVTAATADAGAFSVAARLVAAGLLPLQAVRLVIAPHLSRALDTSARDTAGRMHVASTSWAVLASWPLFLLFVVFAPTVMGVFGESFAERWVLLAVLSIAGMVGVGAGNVQTLVLMSGLAATYCAIAVANLLLNVVGSFTLGSLAGAEGVAAMAVVSAVLENVVMILVAARLLRVHTLGRPLAVSTGLCVACFGVLGAVVRYAGFSTLAGLTATGVIGAALLVAGCWRFRRMFTIEGDAGARA